ncbi:Glycosyl hydrolase catalytic core [Geosmithia morbida]|uniref:Glycosyl hydrolase catalytic core n=1 Tax=Geosmithia morbida TaxID=1094350 RepID=A0A9P5D8E8_9HYPO|nr:Glycosyl hydrolase catalytic core [Geosmithia morbida]KAF4125449.1 Glycosyl hydrolase catalytic core [Geosmithia morbida]
MVKISIASVAAVLIGVASAADSPSPSKRGLCFVPDEKHPDDNSIWTEPGSDLSWYYNYGELPSPVYSGKDSFEFVPMMWGANSSNPEDTTWLDSVTSLMDDQGVNVSHVLAFNEPDAPSSWGGSDLDPKIAARAWVANFEPLARRGVKLGLPGCTGGTGSLPWLRQFLSNCSDILAERSESSSKRNCTWDFLPVHWYDNFEGLASHIGERRGEWPGAEIWITEYAYANQDLSATQAFYNETAEWFDGQDYIGRYSYFGAFRSDNSNVGPNAAFLSKGGQLTDIGSWYLGFSATGVDPQSSKESPAASTYPTTRTATLAMAFLALSAML